MRKANPEKGIPWRFGPDWPGQRCDAKTRKGTVCQKPPLTGKARCRLHGGLSTGPKTLEGKARLAELERSRAAQIAEEKALKQMAEATRLKAAKDWSDYQERQKTIMEQVYNFSTTGYPEGLKRLRWIEVQPCILTDGIRQIDNRMLNMTAFRIYRDYIGSAWYMISTDMNVSFSTPEKIPIERLQKAWVLAFQNCPGKTSSF